MIIQYDNELINTNKCINIKLYKNKIQFITNIDGFKCDGYTAIYQYEDEAVESFNKIIHAINNDIKYITIKFIVNLYQGICL